LVIFITVLFKTKFNFPSISISSSTIIGSNVNSLSVSNYEIAIFSISPILLALRVNLTTGGTIIFGLFWSDKNKSDFENKEIEINKYKKVFT